MNEFEDLRNSQLSIVFSGNGTKKNRNLLERNIARNEGANIWNSEEQNLLDKVS